MKEKYVKNVAVKIVSRAQPFVETEILLVIWVCDDQNAEVGLEHCPWRTAFGSHPVRGQSGSSMTACGGCSDAVMPAVHSFQGCRESSQSAEGFHHVCGRFGTNSRDVDYIERKPWVGGLRKQIRLQGVKRNWCI